MNRLVYLRVARAMLIAEILLVSGFARPLLGMAAAEGSSTRATAKMLPSYPTSVRLVSAAKYKTLQEAVDKERFLYIPPGYYALKEPLKLQGWRGGVLLGAGRFTTSLLGGEKGVLQISDCQNVLIANLTVGGDDIRKGAAVEVVGPAANSVAFASVIFFAGVIQAGKTDDRFGGVALRLAAPGKYTVQGCHFFRSLVGLEVAHAKADASILGGNFQSDRTHIRQTAGRVLARSIGFQAAFGGADVEIGSASTHGAHLLEGCRTEGPDTMLCVPDTEAKVHVILSCNCAYVRRLASYGGCGTLVLLGNNVHPGLSHVGMEAPAKSGPCQIRSYGNTLGSIFDPGGPFVLGPRAKALTVGDLTNTLKPKAAFVSPGNRFVDGARYQEAGREPPAHLTVGEPPKSDSLLKDLPAHEPVTIPRVENIGELVVSVRKYGARGDGKTDDSAALAKAVQSERHKPIYFPAGRYLVSKPLLVRYWRGASFWGDGCEQSVLVSSSGESAFATDSCGFAVFVDLGFETASQAKAPAFDLNWKKGPALPDGTGAALQANMFYRCRFQGGQSGLSIGRDDLMGSENLLVDCLFRRANAGLFIGNYNALTNTVLRGTFDDLDFGVKQAAGSFNLYDCRLQAIRKCVGQVTTSANDTFMLSRLDLKEPFRLFGTSHTGAVINVTVQNCRFPSAAKDPILFDYEAGGSVIVRDCDLSNRTVRVEGAVAHSAVVVLHSWYKSPQLIETSNLAKAFVSAAQNRP